MMGLLCRAGISEDSVQTAMTPLRRGLEMSARRRNSGGARRRREEALRESLRIANDVLASANDAPVSPSDDRRVDKFLPAFIEHGDNPDATAASIVAAYERKGASINDAVGIAFHLVNEVETPSRRLGVPFLREDRTQNAREKRERLAIALNGHLSVERNVLSLPIALVARQISLHRNQADALSGLDEVQIIDAGQGLEILSEGGAAVQVRAANGMHGYVARANLMRLPILPTDEVALQAEYSIAEAVMEDDDKEDEIQQTGFDDDGNSVDEKAEKTT